MITLPKKAPDVASVHASPAYVCTVPPALALLAVRIASSLFAAVIVPDRRAGT